jgi:cytochrome c5
MSLWSMALVPVVILIVVLIACSPSRSDGNGIGYRPQYIYQKFCAPCHDATGLQLIKDPPPLDGLFRKKTFPSGAPATDDGLRNVILHGLGSMPPFEGTLSGDDVSALVRYMHTR